MVRAFLILFVSLINLGQLVHAQSIADQKAFSLYFFPRTPIELLEGPELVNPGLSHNLAVVRDCAFGCYQHLAPIRKLKIASFESLEDVYRFLGAYIPKYLEAIDQFHSDVQVAGYRISLAAAADFYSQEGASGGIGIPKTAEPVELIRKNAIKLLSNLVELGRNIHQSYGSMDSALHEFLNSVSGQLSAYDFYVLPLPQAYPGQHFSERVGFFPMARVSNRQEVPANVRPEFWNSVYGSGTGRGIRSGDRSLGSHGSPEEVPEEEEPDERTLNKLVIKEVLQVDDSFGYKTLQEKVRRVVSGAMTEGLGRYAKVSYTKKLNKTSKEADARIESFLADRKEPDDAFEAALQSLIPPRIEGLALSVTKWRDIYAEIVKLNTFEEDSAMWRVVEEIVVMRQLLAALLDVHQHLTINSQSKITGVLKGLQREFTNMLIAQTDSDPLEYLKVKIHNRFVKQVIGVIIGLWQNQPKGKNSESAKINPCEILNDMLVTKIRNLTAELSALRSALEINHRSELESIFESLSDQT